MRASLLIGVVVVALQVGGSAAFASCAKPARESERLLCQAESIKAKRFQSTAGAAITGAILGNLTALATGGDRSDATVAGAVTGGLTGYWLSVQKELAARHASQAAQAKELKALAARDAKAQKASAKVLKAELKTVLLRTPGADEDPKRRQKEILEIAKAADLGAKQASSSAKGYTAVGGQIGTSVNGDGLFAGTAQDFGRTRQDACAKLTRPAQVCAS